MARTSARTTRPRSSTRIVAVSAPDPRALDGLLCDGFIWKYLEPHFARTLAGSSPALPRARKVGPAGRTQIESGSTRSPTT